MSEDSWDIPDNVKVLVATPNYTNLFDSSTHVNHIECATQWTKWGIDFNWTVVGRTFVHFARTQMCQAAVDGDFTHIFWVDDDAIIQPNFLPRFLSHRKDVVIAPYPMRKMPHEIGVLYSKTGNFHDHASYKNMELDELDQGLIQVDGGGTHCMLMSTETLLRAGEGTDEMSVPAELTAAFENLTDEQRLLAKQFIGEPMEGLRSFADEDTGGNMSYFVMPKSGTEDMYWCYRAKRKGIEVWCDTDVFADHLGFTPTVTRGWCEHAKQAMADNNLQSTQRLTIIPGDSDSRDHHGIVRDKTSNLI